MAQSEKNFRSGKQHPADEDGSYDSHSVGNQSGRHGVASAFYGDRSKIDRNDIEGSFRAAKDCSRRPRYEAVRAEFSHEVGEQSL